MIGAIFVSLVMASSAPTSQATLVEIHRAGVERYDAQDFDGAIAEWEKLGRFRVESAEVEFNLGNAYFQKRDYGRAVLHWERALRLQPSDDDARDNLKLARERLVDQVPPDDGILATVVTRAQRILGRERTSWIALISWLLLGAAGFAAALSGDTLRRVAIALILVSFVVLLMTAPLAWLQVQASEDRSRYVVLTPAVEVRSGPGEQYVTVLTVHEGLVVKSRESVSGWERVRLPNQAEGWVPASSIERI